MTPPRILITRASHQSSALAESLRALGLEPILIPTIELTEPTTYAPLDAALAALVTPNNPAAFHWLLFTSANAVEAFHRRYLSLEGTSLNPPVIPQASQGLIRRGDTQASQGLIRRGDTQASQGLMRRGDNQASQGFIRRGDNQASQGFIRRGDNQASQGLIRRGDNQASQGFIRRGDNQVPQGFSLGSHGPTLEEGALAPEVCLPLRLKIAAIGPATAQALEAIGLHADLIPPQAVAESLAEALLPHALQPDGSPTHFLLIRAEQARDTLPDALRAAGAKVTIAPAYRTTIPSYSIPAIRNLFSDPTSYPNAISFTSSSTATNLLALLEVAKRELPTQIPRISIGPITSQTLRDLHLPPHAEAAQPTIPALIESIVKSLNLKKAV